MEINYTSQLTMQEAFDKMVSAIKMQGQPSITIDSKVCNYRSINGNKCAIGHLISDDQIKLFNISEGFAASRFPLQLCEELIACCDVYDSRHFLEDMQVAHDNAATTYPLNNNLFMNEFLIECEEVAKKWQLNYG